MTRSPDERAGADPVLGSKEKGDVHAERSSGRHGVDGGAAVARPRGLSDRARRCEFGRRSSDGIGQAAAARKEWFTLFRFYGPDQPLLDKHWTLANLEKVR